MVQKIFTRLGWFVLLLLLQVLLFGHIHLFGYATPMPYVYFLIILSLDTPRWLYLVSAFALGLAIDIFSCTPGMTSASLCAVASSPLGCLRNSVRPTRRAKTSPPRHVA